MAHRGGTIRRQNGTSVDTSLKNQKLIIDLPIETNYNPNSNLNSIRSTPVTPLLHLGNMQQQPIFRSHCNETVFLHLKSLDLFEFE